MTNLLQFTPRPVPPPAPVESGPAPTEAGYFFANGARCLKIFDAAGNCLSIPEDGNCTHVFPAGMPESEQDYSHDRWLKTPEDLLASLAAFLGYDVYPAQKLQPRPRSLIDDNILKQLM